MKQGICKIMKKAYQAYQTKKTPPKKNNYI